MGEFYHRRKKVCLMCKGQSFSYKDPEGLKKFINEKGKIVSRRVTGNCARHQRCIATEIKRARAIGYLPYTK